MSTALLRKNYLCGGAITKHRIVKYDSADFKVVQADGSTVALLGVLEETTAASGDRRDITVGGQAQVEYGGNVTRGDLLTSDANGKAVAVTRHTHTENTDAAYTQNATTGAASNVRVIGTAEVSGVSGDIGIVNIHLGAA